MIEAKDISLNRLFLFNKKLFRIDTIEWLTSESGMVGMFPNGNKTKAPLRATLDFLEPIPLTEEWLIRFGFEKDGFECLSKDISAFPDAFKRIVVSGDYVYLREGAINGRPHEDDLTVLWNRDLMKHFLVHELQNLYHILTRKELELAPNSK